MSLRISIASTPSKEAALEVNLRLPSVGSTLTDSIKLLSKEASFLLEIT